jgi:AcrR family transcriptional regulator
VAGSNTRDALLAQGAILFARHGVTGVTARQLHEAVGARNESALHYHFGGRDGLVTEILRQHLEAIEARRAPLVAAIESGGRSDDLRALVHALAAPMADDLPSELGRAHLRLVAQMSHPALAYEPPFRLVEAPAGTTVARWLTAALAWLPEPVCRERLAALRTQLISLFGVRAQLLDEQPGGGRRSTDELFVQDLVDILVAGLAVAPSAETLAAMPQKGGRSGPNG